MKFPAYLRSLAAKFFHRSQTEADIEEELSRSKDLRENNGRGSDIGNSGEKRP